MYAKFVLQPDIYQTFSTLITKTCNVPRLPKDLQKEKPYFLNPPAAKMSGIPTF